MIVSLLNHSRHRRPTEFLLNLIFHSVFEGMEATTVSPREINFAYWQVVAFLYRFWYSQEFLRAQNILEATIFKLNWIPSLRRCFSDIWWSCCCSLGCAWRIQVPVERLDWEDTGVLNHEIV